MNKTARVALADASRELLPWSHESSRADMGGDGQPMGEPVITRPRRKRLSRACNWCRKQKVRCDESLPSCSNCRLRNIACKTTEPSSGKEIASTGRRHSTNRPRQRREKAASFSECRSDPDSPFSSTTASSATSLLVIATPASLPTDICSPASTLRPTGTSALLWSTFPTPERTTITQPTISSRDALPPLPPEPRTETPRAAQEERRRTPVLTPQSSDYAINYGDEPVRRKFLGASSLQVLVQWLDLSFSRRGPWPTVSPFFRYGISTAEEFTHDLWSLPKLLPPSSECSKCLQVYQSRIHPLFPVLDTPEFPGIFSELAERDPRSLPSSDLPSLACCYALMTIGMDAMSGKPSDLATEYLTSAYSMYAHIVAMPYLRSIQALLLLALALRGRHKEGVAWHVIGHAVRMSQSLGLHRQQNSRRAQSEANRDVADSQADLDRRTWWSLYCLEKMMALQTGRPSAIRDEDCDQAVLTQDSSSSGSTRGYLHHLVGLSRIQSAMVKNVTTQAYRPKSMTDFFREAANIDSRLVEWAERLPTHLRPGSTLYCTPDDLPFAAFFSACYHETMITLHRTALILDTNVFREQVTRRVPDSQSSYRLSQAEDICIASARAIVRVLNELKTSCGDFANLLTVTLPLLSTFVLTISILKHPTRWSVNSDLTLLLNVATLAEDIFVSMGQDPTFNKMFALMRDAASKHVELTEANHEQGQPVPDTAQPQESPDAPTRQEWCPVHHVSTGRHQQQEHDTADSDGDDGNNRFPQQPMDFDSYLNEDEPWMQLFSGNLDFGSVPWDHDLDSFLGLPMF